MAIRDIYFPFCPPPLGGGKKMAEGKKNGVKKMKNEKNERMKKKEKKMKKRCKKRRISTKNVFSRVDII